jgi:hypothetical protein
LLKRSRPQRVWHLNRVHSVGDVAVAILIGRRLKLEIATLAANDLNGMLALTTIPGGDIVKADPSDGARMVKVLWRGLTLVMFALDLKQRAIEFKEARRAFCDPGLTALAKAGGENLCRIPGVSCRPACRFP